MNWYKSLRSQYRPDSISVVFLGESAPDPRGESRRFFYSPELSQHDNLFRGLMLALYGANKDDLTGRKVEWLRRFQSDGYWLLDVAPYPVNGLSTGERRRVLQEDAPSAVEMIRAANPSVGVIVCHGGAFRAVESCLRDGGVKVLHDTPIPFPLGNTREEFAKRVRDYLF